MQASEVFNVSNGKIIPELCAVDNQFIRQLAMLAKQEGRNMRPVSFILKDLSQNRGEVAQRGIPLPDKSVIDICKLTPLTTTYPVRTLMDEVAHFRSDMLSFPYVTEDFAKDHRDILFIDYLLSSSLCFIEIFGDGERVDKFFATRNRAIAGEVAGLDESETTKYGTYLQSYEVNYQTKQLKVLKLTTNKNGYRVTQPRSHIDFTQNIKITPVFLMAALVEGIWGVLKDNVVRFKYIKDNLTEREFIATLSVPYLSEVYDVDTVQKVFSNISSVLTRGYVRLPEYGISKYDRSGVRALNISRITSIEIINPSDVDMSFVNVDFDSILPSFKEAVMGMTEIKILRMIYEELTGSLSTSTSLADIKFSLIEFVESQYTIGTTMALRHIHKYMIGRSEFFPSYTGERVEYTGFGTGGFNLGTVE